MAKLVAGVIGAGVFGTFHARKYASLADVELKGIFDTDHERAKTLAREVGAAALTHMTGVIASSDLVTIASPAFHHGRAALMAVQAGAHVYVEKPIATDLKTAEKILEEAAKRKLVVAVGHQERAVFQAMGLLDIPEEPIRLEAVREGPQSDRNMDVSATLDLMVHDIDLALSLARGEPVTVEADGDDDAAKAEVTFDSGFVANFEVNRKAPERRRTMKIVYPLGVVEVDFLARTFSNTTPYDLNPDFADTPAGKDPLEASVQAFLDAVRGKAPRPLVTGEEATRALDVTLAVEKAIAEG
jgi:predicted dehydrogenase